MRKFDKSVRAKKHLGQHFLKDETVAQRIADTVDESTCKNIVEIGPGMGVLTKYLLEKEGKDTYVVELDRESVAFLEQNFPKLDQRIIPADFLKWNPATIFGEQEYVITGNFPYNISSQIVFNVLEQKEFIPFFSGMFQKEVAQRICSGPGNKDYGILSVFCQAYFDVEYLFTVPKEVFNPPPKVESGVMKMVRKENFELGCDWKKMRMIVKTAFNQRRKTVRNALKNLNLSPDLSEQWWAGKRAEQLSWEDYVEITNWTENHEL